MIHRLISLVILLPLAVCGGGCGDGSSSFTIEGEDFFPAIGEKQVVLITYTLKPNARKQISISTSEAIWVGVSIMDAELFKKHGTACAKIQNKEGTRSAKSCLGGATTFEPTNDKIELILENLLETSLEVSVYVEPVEQEAAIPPAPTPLAGSVRIPKIGETREWDLLDCTVVASGNQGTSYLFDSTQALLMHADEKSWGKMLRKASGKFEITVDPSIPSAKTPFEEMLRPHHPPGPFVLYECVPKK